VKEMTAEENKISEFLLAHGGPFYSLQRQLGLLHENAFRAGSRAFLFVTLAWGIPLVFSIIAGSAYGPATDNPYLHDLGVWARFFVAIALFLLMERKLEKQLRTYLLQFVRAPLLAPGSFEAAATAVTRALKRRDAKTAEAVCLLIAALISLVLCQRLLTLDASTWAVQVTSDGNRLTLAGWWAVIVSNTLFAFLLLRWLWRLCVWGLLLRDLAGLELRLVAAHPDSHGGLSFLGNYPNAYAPFVFAVSCVLGAAVAHELLDEALTNTTYGIIMAGWLLVILVLFAIPLQAFSKPLGKLKEQTLLAYSARATQHHRAVERELLGRNIAAAEDSDKATVGDIPDPAKAYAATRKLSGMLVSRTTLLPLSAAALLPLVAAGTTQLPLKDILKVMKRLLLL
jgi:hypothetical protein